MVPKELITQRMQAGAKDIEFPLASLPRRFGAPGLPELNASQVRHLDTSEKSELYKLQQLKDEQGTGNADVDEVVGTIEGETAGAAVVTGVVSAATAEAMTADSINAATITDVDTGLPATNVDAAEVPWAENAQSIAAAVDDIAVTGIRANAAPDVVGSGVVSMAAFTTDIAPESERRKRGAASSLSKTHAPVFVVVNETPDAIEAIAANAGSLAVAAASTDSFGVAADK